MDSMKRSRLLEILGSFKKLRVIVVGDFALDAYWYADMTRSELSRETPHYTRPITRETFSPGASGNICCNVKVLGVKEVYPITVIGKDWQGKILQEELKRFEINLDNIIVSEQRVTSTYIKPTLCGLDSQQEDSRLDFVNFNPLTKTLEENLIKKIRLVLSKADAIIIEDQMVQNGIVTANIRENLIQLAEEYPEKIFIADSREQIGQFRNIVLKPNRIEAVRAISPSKNPQEMDMDGLERIGIELQKKAQRPVYITLSEKGALLITETAQHYLPATPTKPPIDPVGAGDTFISATAASLAGDANPIEAGIVANLTAGVVVKKLNITGTASPEEILKKFDESSKAGEWP